MKLLRENLPELHDVRKSKLGCNNFVRMTPSQLTSIRRHISSNGPENRIPAKSPFLSK